MLTLYIERVYMDLISHNLNIFVVVYVYINWSEESWEYNL